MVESVRTIVAWCRCGPHAQVLQDITHAQTGQRVRWIGRPRWVSEGAVLEVGRSVILCEADLCHQPGCVRAVAFARLDVVRITNFEIDLTLIYEAQTDSRWKKCGDYGKLVFAAQSVLETADLLAGLP